MFLSWLADCGRPRNGRVLALARAVTATVLFALSAGALSAPGARAATAATAADREGTPSAFTISDPRISESSGLAASRAHPGVYWTHNDSGDGPHVYAVDGTSGRTLATVTLTGVTARDWEALSVGPDGQLYVGDIGDNDGVVWPEVWIYRFPEPERLGDVTVTPTRYTVRYEDGPRDAEALMVHPRTGRIHIVSKSSQGKGGIYRGPAELVPSGSGINTFRRTADIDLWATDGAFSPDGSRLVLRGYAMAAAYQWQEGKPPRRLGAVRVPVQRQGESVTFTPDGRALMYGTEGANSEVQPVELVGRQLPDDVIAAQKAEEAEEAEEGTDRAEGRGEGARGGRDGSSGGAEDEPSGTGGNPAMTVGLATIVLVAVLATRIRRLFGRR